MENGTRWAAATRMFNGEDRINDLIALLAALDPAPLGLIFTVADPAALTVTREAAVATGIRLDLLITHSGDPVGFIEGKLAAAQHGDQYSRYDDWADRVDVPTGNRVIAALDDDPADVPQSWRRWNLVDLLGLWSDSADPAARQIARLAVETVSGWRARLAGPLGALDLPALRFVVTRTLAQRLRTTPQGRPVSTWAGSTSGGRPMMVAFAPYGDESDLSVCVDVRADADAVIGDCSAPWVFRYGVQADLDQDADRTTAEKRIAARLRAHGAAMSLREQMKLPRLHDALRTGDLGAPASALSSARSGRSTTGLKRPGDLQEQAARWTASISDGASRAHPLFFGDWGRRLVAISDLDVAALTIDDLESLVLATLDHLAASVPTAA